MIISRRPNKRRSMESAPGPSKAIAAAMITTRNAGSGALKRFEAGGGTHDRAMPIVASAISTPATGVRNPIKSDTPLAMTIKPASDAADPLPGSVRYDPPWTTAVTPTATRSRSKPTPGQPPGKAENNRCRSCLLCAAALQCKRATLSVIVSVEKKVPIAWNLFVTL